MDYEKSKEGLSYMLIVIKLRVKWECYKWILIMNNLVCTIEKERKMTKDKNRHAL